MSRIGSREIVFVCASISNNELFTKIIAGNTQEEASKLFVEEFNHNPSQIMGPFYKKKKQIVEITRVLKFSNIKKRAVYNEWIVDAHFLKEPENYAYLIFIKRIDDNKIPFPKGTITVPISDLRIENVK
jgi:hypothetical protein